MNAIELETKWGFEVYPKRDITLVRGQGATVWDDNGRAYIDCTAGVGVASVGHANPKVAEAIAKQASTLITCPGIFYNDVRAKLVEKLVDITPSSLTRAFLCNSGTEAMEAAIKFARHGTGRNEFVCAMRGFHGRTMGALSATFKYREAFEPLLPGFEFVPYNKIEKLTDAISDTTAAVIVEPVQGEGGVRLGDREFLKTAQFLCNQHGAMLVMDEIQTGFCRTGAMFACEHHGLEPDILCLAKAIAGGVPMGAVMTSAKIEPGVGVHGTTFGGNPLAAAAALATIEFMQNHDLANESARKGARFVARLSETLPSSVREIRQLGLMIGIELKEKAKPHLLALMDAGILALPAGPTVIRLLPPLVISDEELDQVADELLAALNT
ncbi:MAG: acetylornithine/succinylornithine family transaminase [Woeseiaceae bacterium]|nr:acetylornithine/succinylornithine family transaminase [Woeseiaceae bacterium]